VTETRIAKVKGLDIVVKQLTEGQIGVMAREYARLRRSTGTGQDKMVSAGRIMDVLESAIVSQEDKDRLYDLTIAGELDLSDMQSIAVAFDQQEAPAPAAVKPAVRRGRPKRT